MRPCCVDECESASEEACCVVREDVRECESSERGAIRASERGLLRRERVRALRRSTRERQEHERRAEGSGGVSEGESVSASEGA